MDDLVAELQAEGEAISESLNESAARLVEAHRRRIEIAHQILETVSSAGVHVKPGDVVPSTADEAARAASRLLGQGGELPPRLRGATRERMLAVIHAKEAAVA